MFCFRMKKWICTSGSPSVCLRCLTQRSTESLKFQRYSTRTAAITCSGGCCCGFTIMMAGKYPCVCIYKLSVAMHHSGSDGKDLLRPGLPNLSGESPPSGAQWHHRRGAPRLAELQSGLAPPAGLLPVSPGDQPQHRCIYKKRHWNTPLFLDCSPEMTSTKRLKDFWGHTVKTNCTRLQNYLKGLRPPSIRS